MGPVYFGPNNHFRPENWLWLLWKYVDEILLGCFVGFFCVIQLDESHGRRILRYRLEIPAINDLGRVFYESFIFRMMSKDVYEFYWVNFLWNHKKFKQSWNIYHSNAVLTFQMKVFNIFFHSRQKCRQICET